MNVITGENGSGKSTISKVVGKAKGISVEEISHATLYDQEDRVYTDVQNIHVFNEDYINYVVSHLKFGKKRIKVVLDPANGVSSTIARDIFEKLNIDLTIINEESDGTFPNHHPDPTIESNLEELKAKVLEIGADIGIGFDGDGDRIGIVDELGNMVSIEAYAVIILRNIIDKVTKEDIVSVAKKIKLNTVYVLNGGKNEGN